jgi:trans-aconitate methyltransferase
MGQFHLDAETYLAMVRSEIGGYDALQVQLTDTTADRTAQTILDLGSGTGETAAAILKRHPMAKLTGIDSSEDMLSMSLPLPNRWMRRIPSKKVSTSQAQSQRCLGG